MVADTVVDFENFEAAAIGDTIFDGDANEFDWLTTYWECCPDCWYQYGSYAELFDNLEDHDPCNNNLSSQVTFFAGSPFPSTSYPGLYDTPFCYASCIYFQNEMIASPVLDLTKYSTAGDENQDGDIPPGTLATLGGLRLGYTVYRDLPLENLVFYYWKVREIVNGCAMQWKNHGDLFYGDEARYFFETHDIGDLVTSDSIQVAVGLVDMCSVWYGIKGDCAAHTPSPWFDNISVKRYATIGPQWTYRDIDLFQDNFPSDPGDIESFVRADMAMDINDAEVPLIRPGDSIVVSCASPVGGGIAEDAFGPRVYMHVKVTHLGPDAKTPPSGAVLAGDHVIYHGMEGDWTVIQGDTARAGGSVVPGRYMFDLNDSLLTRGFMIEYYFEAFDDGGESTTLPADAQSLPGEGMYRGSSYFFEFTCLPTLYGDMLYVDDYHGIGTMDGIVQHYFDAAFEAVMWETQYPDRYDVNGPTSLVSNGPASRATYSQLAGGYDFIIWDSGDLSAGTICDGTAGSDKSNDCGLLVDWLEFTYGDRTLWVLGDNVAADLEGLASSDALSLLHYWCGVTLEHDSYFEMTGGMAGGGVISPTVLAVPAVDPFSVADTVCLAGGCPYFKDFDVLGATEDGEYALQYPDYGGSDYYAAVKTRHDEYGDDKRTMWFGFSFMNVRDCSLPYPTMPVVRNALLYHMIYWHCEAVGCTQYDITESETPHVNSLAQNYPNPFNPVTTIRYSVKNEGPVTLKIYDVSGRLVCTLVDVVTKPGAYTVTWRGVNDRGTKVASGVYFYRIGAGDFVQTKKMVLLR